jgi:hypothetical protein
MDERLAQANGASRSQQQKTTYEAAPEFTCTQVVMCVVWTIAHEKPDQNQKQKQKQKRQVDAVHVGARLPAI